VWANVNTVRGFNLISIVACLTAVAGAEYTIRNTVASAAWGVDGARTTADSEYGWVDLNRTGFAEMESGEHKAYPDRGYPVVIPARDERPRVVVMGGSSTGGAFQNDDLNEFYPAGMAERWSGEVQVLNQGVGGWTTWHIRKYLAEHIEVLDPDILVVYAGNNDSFSDTGGTLEVLYQRWKQTGLQSQASALLNQSRLYRGLGFVLRAASGSAEGSAVPLEDARENYADIIRRVSERGGVVVLASEGIAPDPAPLFAYKEMMRAHAEASEAVFFVDTASRLHDAQGAPVFLDEVHLTEAGHTVVADALVEVIGPLLE